jgi:hypothetical protein
MNNSLDMELIRRIDAQFSILIAAENKRINDELISNRPATPDQIASAIIQVIRERQIATKL